ncbi:TetR/AcrR family transcriptional regulator [Pseudooceanicola sp.]|uniref:TetR/AcrR family transcriptional regulator n=1 Tax=Pseudooceanicola sp. TaxID=1914328 RepID=UPI00263767D3|nr:TetR/AcrR family transcriptional regulator [Pseudooceanicola sp.]MDF1857157.1 TetR/AcrR family transcriptional regulator [Pseudooceanicola sp.]
MATDQTKAKAAARPARAPRAPRGSRRDAIADVAMGLFARNGFDRTSIRDIAAAAGLTKPALYYHFQDKEALYEHVLVERMNKLINSVRTAMAASDDPVEKIRAFLRDHSSRIDRERDQWLMSRQGFQSISDPERRRRVTELRDRFERILRDQIETAVEAGLLDRSADSALVARMLLSSVNDIPRWLNPDGGLNTRDVALTYVDIALRGLGIGRQP